METNLKYPSIRADLTSYLKKLADRKFQDLHWKNPNLIDSAPCDCFDHAVHFFFDDTVLSENPEAAIGVFLLDQHEVQAIKQVVLAIELLLNKHGIDLSDAHYIATPEWDRVVVAANRALGILKEGSSDS